MDIESRIQVGLHPDKIRLRQFIKDTVLYVMANDPGVGQDATARVRSLRMRLSDSGDFKPVIGLLIIIVQRRVRQQYPEYEDRVRRSVEALTIVNDTKAEFSDAFEKIEDYVTALCRKYLNKRRPDCYFLFLCAVSEVCCKIAEMNDHERLISYFLQRAGHYMTVYHEAFPGYDALAYYSGVELSMYRDYEEFVRGMDIESRIQVGLHPDKIRLRQFIKDTVLYVMANDPGVGQDATARVRSLGMRLSDSGDFKPVIGLLIIIVQRRVRQQYPEYEDRVRRSVKALTIVNDTKAEFSDAFEKIEDYVTALCRKYLNKRRPDCYFLFLCAVSEVCCKIAEMNDHERLISYFLQRAGHYMTVCSGAFPGYDALAYYAEVELRMYRDYEEFVRGIDF